LARTASLSAKITRRSSGEAKGEANLKDGNEKPVEILKNVKAEGCGLTDRCFASARPALPEQKSGRQAAGDFLSPDTIQGQVFAESVRGANMRLRAAA